MYEASLTLKRYNVAAWNAAILFMFAAIPDWEVWVLARTTIPFMSIDAMMRMPAAFATAFSHGCKTLMCPSL